jgi:chromodomain-helicase-DNA-binding protein 7
MQLRKCCNHPMMIKEMWNELANRAGDNGAEYLKLLIESSGKMILLDKLLAKFLSEGKKVLVFSQFT